MPNSQNTNSEMSVEPVAVATPQQKPKALSRVSNSPHVHFKPGRNRDPFFFFFLFLIFNQSELVKLSLAVDRCALDIYLIAWRTKAQGTAILYPFRPQFCTYCNSSAVFTCKIETLLSDHYFSAEVYLFTWSSDGGNGMWMGCLSVCPLFTPQLHFQVSAHFQMNYSSDWPQTWWMYSLWDLPD